MRRPCLWSKVTQCSNCLQMKNDNGSTGCWEKYTGVKEEEEGRKEKLCSAASSLLPLSAIQIRLADKVINFLPFFSAKDKKRTRKKERCTEKNCMCKFLSFSGFFFSYNSPVSAQPMFSLCLACAHPLLGLPCVSVVSLLWMCPPVAATGHKIV